LKVAPADFERIFPVAVAEQLRGLLLAVEDETSSRVTGYMESRAANRTGRLKASLRVTRGAGLAPDEIGFDAPYSAVLNKGRKRSKAYTFRTPTGKKAQVPKRMLGSKQEQARRGMTRGTLRQLRREWPEIIQAASSKVGEGS
jgi:hypothetical protein